MSGDVQPRKRKDKKRKKDELGVEEPRGTAAALGEGDVFMHSHHEHGTGGHWCAKIIFFSLLAVLITLIGLIILENRGLTELEANSVESRYSGVLEGWLEDAPDDDHHDEHTLELKHHDAEEEEEEADDEPEVELERIEQEAVDEEAISTELPALQEDSDEINDDDQDLVAVTKEEDSDDNEDADFIDNDEIDEEPPVERIVVPPGKPFQEVDEDESSERPPVDTLAEEEEYEKRQEELRKVKAQASHEDGGNSIEDEWPGEPSDAFWRQELDEAERDLRQGLWTSVSERVAVPQLKGSGRARWILAKALDGLAEAKRSNQILSQAITAYIELLKMSDHLSDKKLLEITNRTLDRIHFRGNYLNAEPIHRLLIRRFPNDPAYRNNLSISFLMANRADLAAEVLKETVQRWPNDYLALGNYGFVLKTHFKRLEESVGFFKKSLEGDVGKAHEQRFYYHLGDALLLLSRHAEAKQVHKKAAERGIFLSAAQRSLYNVDRLKGKPWWDIDETPYANMARSLEKSWKDILKEGEAARALYEEEKEGLRLSGDWSQLDLFARGREIPGRCKRAPVTCSIVKQESAASACSRGQIKFSLIDPGTHVRPHVGPTNCRLRMHLALSNTKNTFLRVDQETREWQVGKTWLFDDSFEHEVWHNGTKPRLILIVDVWHPELTPAERRSLPAI